MRLFLLVAALLLPQVLLAQFNSFEPGSYVRVDQPLVRQQATLKLRGCTELLVKEAKGKPTILSPQQVSSFHMGGQKYLSVGGFTVEQGLDGDTVDHAFVQQLDSGQLLLMRFHFIVDGPPVSAARSGLATAVSVAAGGGVMLMGSSRSYTLLLLQRAGEAKITPIPANFFSGGGQKFRDALLPYLASRPDLAKLVEDKLVTIDYLPHLVRAFNSGQASTPIVPATTTN